jgi:hypothetical protein
MKKLFTLIALVVLTINAQAQRHCNLVITSATFTHGTVYTDTSLVPFYATVKNLGPDSLQTNDTVAFYLVVYDPYTHNYNYSGTGVIFLGLPTMNVGDSLTFIDTTGSAIPSTYYWIHSSDSLAPLCLNVFGVNGSADSLTADTASASVFCMNITYLDIHQLAISQNGLKLYPNPAQAELNFDVNLNKSGNLSLRILDMMGRIVLVQNEGMTNAGNKKITINTGALSDGMYIYQVLVDAETTTGRFSIIK